MVRIAFISDLHGSYLDLNIRWDGKKTTPEADIIVCAGDMTSMGNKYEVLGFLDWFSGLRYDHKIFIAGNHDFLFELYSDYSKTLIPDNIIYLEDSGCEVMGVKFWGTPQQPKFMKWAFNRTEKELKRVWRKIPTNIDVLITHCPPKGILDPDRKEILHIGSPSLYDAVVNRIKPKIHVFGHAHQGYGILEQDGIKFINASNMNNDYDLVNPIIVSEI